MHIGGDSTSPENVICKQNKQKTILATVSLPKLRLIWEGMDY